MRRGIRNAVGAAVFVAAAIVAGTAAAKGPFGITTPEGGGAGFGGPLVPFFVWIALYQSQFYKVLTGALTTLKENPFGVWLLLGLSFAYGVFHAVGPGHGKAVITSYLVSSRESVRHGVLVSFAAAMVQAAVAIIIVVGGAIVLRFTAMQISDATDWLEAGSYAAIAVIGAWLLWSKSFGGGHHHHHHHAAAAEGGHDHDDNEHDHGDHDHDEHSHRDDHAARQSPVRPRSGVMRAWSAIVAVGIRPCSGAIIVLVFALSQGLFAAGIASAIVMGLGTGLTVAALAAPRGLGAERRAAACRGGIAHRRPPRPGAGDRRRRLRDAPWACSLGRRHRWRSADITRLKRSFPPMRTTKDFARTHHSNWKWKSSRISGPLGWRRRRAEPRVGSW